MNLARGAEQSPPPIMEAIRQRRQRTSARKESGTYRIQWTEWVGQGRRKARRVHTYEGPAEIVGDWIKFDGQRKNRYGNWIAVSRI